MTKRPFRYRGGSERREQLRRALFEEQGGLCHLCGGLMTLERRETTRRGAVGRDFATFDHVKPHSEGGTCYFANLKLAHRKCNNARNSRLLELKVGG